MEETTPDELNVKVSVQEAQGGFFDLQNTVKKDYKSSLHVLDDRLPDVGLVDQQEMYEARRT